MYFAHERSHTDRWKGTEWLLIVTARNKQADRNSLKQEMNANDIMKSIVQLSFNLVVRSVVVNLFVRGKE
jgi:hypothetical protein